MLVHVSCIIAWIGILLCFAAIPYHIGVEKPKKWLTNTCFATYILALILGIWDYKKLLNDAEGFIALTLATIIIVVLVVAPLSKGKWNK